MLHHTRDFLRAMEPAAVAHPTVGHRRHEARPEARSPAWYDDRSNIARLMRWLDAGRELAPGEHSDLVEKPWKFDGDWARFQADLGRAA